MTIVGTHLIAVSALSLTLSACAAHERPPGPRMQPSQVTRVQKLIAERSGSSGTNYRVAPGDKIRIRVPGADELTGEFTVARDGIVSLPLLGDERVAGKTEAQIAEGFRSRLAARYLQSPEVIVSALSHGRKAAVLGAVAKPGFYDLAGSRETILDLLTRAGGITAAASPRIYFTPAQSNGSRPIAMTTGGGLLADATGDSSGSSIEIDLTDLYQGRMIPALELPVRDGDSILVKQGGQVFVEGWVESPKPYDLQRAMTLTQAVTKAGGLSFAASPRAVTLTRQDRNGRLHDYRVDYPGMTAGKEKDIYLEPGDRIHVAASTVKVVPWGLYMFLSGIVRVAIGGGVA
ncbi:MAG: polysaccharide biosynthesis/export family protein, partial [Candidatus Binatia bacterium]